MPNLKVLTVYGLFNSPLTNQGAACSGLRTLNITCEVRFNHWLTFLLRSSS